MVAQSFKGTWRSVNFYRDPKQPGLQGNEYNVNIHQRGDTLIIESLPNPAKSYLIMRLKIDARIAVGTWEEHSSPTGKYEGEIYSGAIQFVLSEDGNMLAGMYTSVDNRAEVKSNYWQIYKK